MSAPPPYVELLKTVENYLTKADELRGWSMDAIEDPEQNKLQAFPFVRDGAVGAHLLYDDAKSGVKVHCEASSVMDSWRALLPTISYTKMVEKITHTVDYDCKKSSLLYSMMHPNFFFSSSCAVADGMSGVVSATTRLCDQAFVGVCTDYDPKRSGLKNLTALAVRRSCPNLCNGDVMAKYSLVDGLALHLRIPVHTHVDVAVIAEKKRFIAGIHGCSPCGARGLLSTNVNDGTCTVSAIRNIGDIWRLSMSYTSGSLCSTGSGKAPRFGLKFSNDSILD